MVVCGRCGCVVVVIVCGQSWSFVVVVVVVVVCGRLWSLSVLWLFVVVVVSCVCGCCGRRGFLQIISKIDSNR